MIERQRTAEHVNCVVNHPSVYPWVRGPIEGPIDLTGLIESGNYVALFGEYGGFLFWNMGQGVYDAHSAVLPEGRGKWAVLAAQHALQWMFEKEDAREIMMAVPKGNLAVRALVRVLQAKFRGTIEDGWIQNGKLVPTDVFSLTKMDWQECR